MKSLIATVIVFVTFLACSLDQKKTLIECIDLLGKEITSESGNLYLITQGYGSADGKDTIDLGLVCIINKPIEISEARILILQMLDKSLEYFDNNKKNLNETVEEPIIWGISVHFYYPNHDSILAPNLGHVDLTSDVIVYQVNEPKENGNPHYTTIFSETYEEAVERAKGYTGPRLFDNKTTGT